MPLTFSSVTVFPYRWVGGVIYASVLALFAGLLGVAGMKGDRGGPFFSLLAVPFLVLAFAQRRRRVIISAGGIAYQPPFGSLQRVPFFEIQTITHGTVRLAGFVYGYDAASADLHLANGSIMQIPIDLPRSNEVLTFIISAWESYGVALANRLDEN